MCVLRQWSWSGTNYLLCPFFQLCVRFSVRTLAVRYTFEVSAHLQTNCRSDWVQVWWINSLWYFDWLTFGSCRFLLSDLSKNFRAFTEKPCIKSSSNPMAELIMGLDRDYRPYQSCLTFVNLICCSFTKIRLPSWTIIHCLGVRSNTTWYTSGDFIKWTRIQV